MKRRSEGSDRGGRKRQRLSNGKTLPVPQRRGETVVEEESEKVHVLLSMCRVNLGRNA